MSLDQSTVGPSPEPEQEAFVSLVRSYECLWSEQNKFFQRFDITRLLDRLEQAGLIWR